MDDRDKIRKVEDLVGFENITRSDLDRTAELILEQDPNLQKNIEADLKLAETSPALALFSALSRAQATKRIGLPPIEKPGKQYIIRQYLMVLQALFEESRHLKSEYTVHDPMLGEEGRKKEAALIWARLNSARIFEIPVRLVEILYHEVDLYICREAGVDWVPPSDVSMLSEGEARHYLRTMKHLRQDVELPQLPFECIYLGFTQPVMIHNKELYSLPDHVTEAWMFGFVVTNHEAFTLIETRSPSHGVNRGIVALCEMMDGSWATPYALTSTPWLVGWIIEWINDHQTVIEEATRSFDYRRKFKKESAKLIKKPIPPPFYTVHMKDQQIDEEEWLERFRRRLDSKIRQAPQHQYDVRGHRVVRYQRGLLPLDPRLEKQLRHDPRRKIFITDKVDSETAAQLAKRRVLPKRVDEWMAVLIYWKHDHRRGPKDGPYIPSVRKSARKREDAQDVHIQREVPG